MTKNFCILTLFLLFSTYFTALAQQPGIIKGTIYQSNTKKPLEDVVIGVKENNTIDISGSKGEFEIQAKIGQSLVFSKLGFNPIEVKIDKTEMTVYLELTGDLVLEELVVVSRKNVNDIDMRKLAGAIETVNASKLSSRSEMDMLNLLQGQVPGLTVTSSGELGGKPQIRIRGESSFQKDEAKISKTDDVAGRITDEFMTRRKSSANEPLYILDGVVISSEAFLALNPADFDEIKVLKDAAACALYGIKAANGVIEMSSKRGQVGERSISFSVKQGMTLRAKRGAEMMNSRQKLELERLLKSSSTPGYLNSEDYIREKYATDPNLELKLANGKAIIDSLGMINTDWHNELLRLSRYESYSLGIRGGTERNLYYYSTNYSKQGGELEGNNVHRFTGRANLDYKISPKFTISLNSSFGMSKRMTPNGTGDNNIYDLIYKLNPYEQMPTSKEGEEAPKLYSFSNRTINDFFKQFKSTTASQRFSGSTVFNWQITKELDLSGVIGADYLIEESKKITSRTAFSEKDAPEQERGSLSEFKATELNISSNIRANYSKIIDDHNIMLGMNYDYYFDKIDNIGFVGYGLPAIVETVAGINQAIVGSRSPRLSGTKEMTAQMGVGISAGYTYKTIYDLYGSYKYDASSLLPKEKRGNVAWALGAGWNIAGYEYFQKQKTITALKLRASYGYTASMAGISLGSAVPVFNYSNSFYAKSRILQMYTMYNPDLKPQTTIAINAGGDVELFKDLTFGVDLYRNTTVDALIDIPLQPSVGFTNMIRNAGVLRNEGIELKLTGNILSSNNWNWTLSTSISYNRNTVLDLYDKKRLFTSNSPVPDMEVGKPLNTLYGLKSLGINPIDGVHRYLSPTGKELSYSDYSNLKEEDFISLGFTTPPYNGFMNSSLSYKEFALSFSIYFTYGGIARANPDLARDRSKAYYNAIADQTEKMWFKEGDTGKTYMNPNPPGQIYDILSYASTANIYKTDFIRLNNVQFSYRIPYKQLEKISRHIRHAQFFCEGENLFAIYREKPKGAIKNYPQSVITLGLNITL